MERFVLGNDFPIRKNKTVRDDEGAGRTFALDLIP